jgi:hypothetical protein
MQGYYNVIKKIKDQLKLDSFVNTVTHGSIDDVDLEKTTIYPLSHLMVGTTTYDERILTFNLSLICMDIVDIKKEDTIDNEDDVLNTQLAVANRLLEILNRGDLYSDKFQLSGSPTLEPFTDRFKDKVAGWTVSFSIIVQNDMTICN